MTNSKTMKTPDRDQNNRKTSMNYEIKIQGHLDQRWQQWFEGMYLTTTENGENGMAYTLISGPVTDQAALHGLLIKIRDMNLTLISVRRIKTERNTE